MKTKIGNLTRTILTGLLALIFCAVLLLPASIARADAPVITDISVSEPDTERFGITASFTASAGVYRVMTAAWTEANGQDDLVWQEAAVSGNTANCTLKVSDHNGEAGTYAVRVYLYDSEGRVAVAEKKVAVPEPEPETAPPAISAVSISEQSAEGYRVTAEFLAEAGVKEVLMPSWTEANGQDELVWHRAQVEGNTASCYIPVSEHRYEGGVYITHVYVTDTKDRTAIAGTSVTIDRGPVGNGHIVCIDPGHQAYGISAQEPNGPGSSVMKAKLSTGTSGVASGVPEHVLNLAVSLKLKAELIARGYQVVMIRETSDCPMSNAERAQLANGSGAEIFVRIHANGSNNRSISGAIFYAPSMGNPYLSAGVKSASISLAQTMVNHYCAVTGLVNRGVLQDDSMSGINWCTIPVTIAEMGFMSNPTEDLMMQDPAFQARMAQGLANGIDAYFGISR